MLYKENIHFTKKGNVEVDKLSIGVPYQDKSNIGRWNNVKEDNRDRGDMWFIPYETVWGKKMHPAMFPVKLPEMCIKLHGLTKDKLIVLDQLLKMFEASKTRVITDLFDAEQTVTEQESITKLKSLKTILTILLETTNWKS